MPRSLSRPVRQENIDASLLPELIEEYFVAKRSTLRANTEVAYRSHLHPFYIWWNGREDHVVNPDVMASFNHWLTHTYRTQYDEPLAHNTRAHCLMVLHGIFTWLYDTGCTDGVRIQDWIPVVHLARPDVHFPEVAEIQSLFDILVNSASPYRLRDLAVVSLLISTGARREEIVKAKIGTIEYRNSAIDEIRHIDHTGAIYLENVKGDADGERNEGRYVVFCNVAGLLLKLYLRTTVRSEDETIFALTGNGIYQMLNRHIMRGDPALKGNLTPHAFRRMFSDAFDQERGSSAWLTLKKQMGHSLSGDITRDHYINSTNKRRDLAELYASHVSVLGKIAIDWKKLPLR